MPQGHVCQKCGVEAPSKYVEFYYNIGMLFMRKHRFIKGYLCKRCIHKSFWVFTAKNLTLGWWGTISLFMTPIFFVNNVVRYVGALGLPATPPDAVPPRLTQDDVRKLAKYRPELAQRLRNKENVSDVAQSIGRSAGVTPGQVILYIRALSQAPRAMPPSAGGQNFPVPPSGVNPASSPNTVEGSESDGEVVGDTTTGIE